MEDLKKENSTEKIKSVKTDDSRRKSVDNIKKLIVLAFVAMFILPFLFCMYLMSRMNDMEVMIDNIDKKLSVMSSELHSSSDVEKTDEVDLEVLDKEAYDNLEINTTKPNEYLTKPDMEKEEADDSDIEKELYIDTEARKVYLTFDDGPSSYTDDILDILAENDVKATFFVCYTQDESLWPMYNRIVEEGHTLGMHSYSHIYSRIYANKEAFIEDVSSLREFLYEQTGIDCKYYRFPGGSSNTVSSVNMQELISYLYSQGIEYYDWNALSGDAVNDKVSPYELNMNVLTYVRDNKKDSMVLMHDLTAIPETVQGLDSLIKQLKSEGFTFCAIDQSTTPVQHVKYKGDSKQEGE